MIDQLSSNITSQVQQPAQQPEINTEEYREEPTTSNGGEKIESDQAAYDIPEYLTVRTNDASASLRFEESKINGEPIIRVLDDEENLIREIPAEEMQQISKQIDLFMKGFKVDPGFLLDKFV